MSAAADAMRKKGIKSVSDNMKPNEELNIPAGLFMAFFGPALIEHYSQQPESCKSQNKK